ncbi:solute carrier family 23 protein [Falseniella ignava]|uniref:Uracil-xanthine permease n=1 Tax=Falseniella ignava CCUG 37419 TaxID=883112 RepID=K1M9A2_9LACT|nr:solute carrier family 23 protein [Falseniella ignava]EKB58963.1 uracil-xanthine permease [Falseniella ignava CCUG 37419]
MENIQTTNQTKMLLDVDDKPKLLPGLLLSFQHVFAMFGATVLVPLILGLSVSTALLASGVGTLIYMILTQFKVPIYLGSSFAYISGMALAIEQMNGDISAAQTGIMMVGLVYVLVSVLIKFIGVEWINYLFPPIVIGPMIIVIGLGLSATAVSNAGLAQDGDLRNVLVAIVTFAVAALVTSKGKGFIQVIPFLIAIIVGYIFALALGLVDLSPVAAANWIQLPEFSLPWGEGAGSYRFYFGPEAWALVPISFVTIAEHMGDSMVISEITGRNFLENPGLDRTILGDGVATFVSAFIGGPANTTYGENTGVIGMTRVASVSVIRNAAIIAILLSCLGKFTALVSTIPSAVLGGMSILLYGVIASNGLKVLITNRVDFAHTRNLIIASAMLVIGLGGAVLNIGGVLMISGTALSAIVGVILNIVLPYETLADANN